MYVYIFKYIIIMITCDMYDLHDILSHILSHILIVVELAVRREDFFFSSSSEASCLEPNIQFSGPPSVDTCQRKVYLPLLPISYG